MFKKRPFWLNLALQDTPEDAHEAVVKAVEPDGDQPRVADGDPQARVRRGEAEELCDGRRAGRSRSEKRRGMVGGIEEFGRTCGAGEDLAGTSTRRSLRASMVRPKGK